MTLTATIDLRMLNALTMFVSNEETRYYLCGVCLEISPRRVIYAATDGHRLVVHRREELDDKTPDNTLLGTFIVPTETCKAIKLRARDRGLGKLQKMGAVTMLESLDSGQQAGVKFIDGTFPDWRRLIPCEDVPEDQRKLTRSMTVNWRYAADIYAFAEKVGLQKPVAHWTCSDGPIFTPIPFSFEYGNTFALVVPMCGEDREWRAPDWLNDPVPQAASDGGRMNEEALGEAVS